MKRRETKNQIRRVRRFLAKEVRNYVTGSSVDDVQALEATGASMCLSLTSLLQNHLALDSEWPHNERWLDGISSPKIEVQSAGAIYVRGEMMWGLRNNVGGDQWAEAFVATVCTRHSGTLSYELSFGNKYRFSARGKA